MVATGLWLHSPACINLLVCPYAHYVIINILTRHTHSVNASCSDEVHEDIICIHTNGSLEDVALL